MKNSWQSRHEWHILDSKRGGGSLMVRYNSVWCWMDVRFYTQLKRRPIQLAGSPSVHADGWPMGRPLASWSLVSVTDPGCFQLEPCCICGRGAQSNCTQCSPSRIIEIFVLVKQLKEERLCQIMTRRRRFPSFFPWMSWETMLFSLTVSSWRTKYQT